MPLQIRRGTTAERLSITPLIGELIYDTQTGELFVGDGTTAGGSSAISGITVEVAQDAAATLFTSGSHNGISFVYDDASNTINATVTSTVLGTYDGDVSGSVFADNSTLLVDAVNAIIPNANIQGWPNQSLSTTDSPTFATLTANTIQVDNVTIGVGGNVNGQGSTLGNFSTIGADLFQGVLDGDMTGSVFADNSTLLVDGIDGRLVGPLHASVFKTDSTLIVDNTTGDITAGNITADDIVGTSVDVIKEGDIPVIDFSRINAGGSAVNVSDTFLRINGRGWDGSNYIVGSRIFSTVTEAVGANSLPADLRFQVFDSSGDLFTYLSMIGGSVERIEGYKPLNVFHNGYVSAGAVFGVYQYHDNVDASNVVFARTRGTDVTQTAVQSGDDIVDLSFLGGNGSGYSPAVSISVVVDDVLSGSNVPGKIVIRTNNGSTGTVERLSIDHNGTTTVTGSLNVVGNANISGSVVTDLVGGVFSGTSSMLIDGTDGSLMTANVNFKGETGNTPADTGTVDSWLELTVNGVTKYMPLYD